MNLLLGLFLEPPSLLLALPVLGAILYRATLSIGVGYTLQVWGQKHTPPTDAALILGLEAVFAVIAGFLGWALDAFDFFLVVIALPRIASDFHVKEPAIAAPGYTMARGAIFFK